jgi:hypothetical protein
MIRRDRVGRYLCGDALCGPTRGFWALPQTHAESILLCPMGHGSSISSLGQHREIFPPNADLWYVWAALMRRRHKESTNGGFAQGLFSLHS